MNTQEREIKLYIQDLPALAERLRICGAELIHERVLERNIRLDTADHSLERGGRLLRLRKDARARVTYKDNAVFEDGVVSRTELEFEVDDFEMAWRLFEALGFRVAARYEKYRREYQLGDVLVMLDELPFGNFVEIEAANNILIDGMVQMLGLDGSRGIATNYLGLMHLVKERLELPFEDLTFENFAGLTVAPSDLGVEPADASG